MAAAPKPVLPSLPSFDELSLKGASTEVLLSILHQASELERRIAIELARPQPVIVQQEAPQERLLNSKQAAERLGISRAYLYDHLKDEYAPLVVRRVKRTLFFGESRIEQFVSGRKDV